MAIHKSQLPGFFVSLLLVTVFSMQFGGVQTNQDSSLQNQVLRSFAGTAHAESVLDSTGPPNQQGACYNVSFSNTLANPCDAIDENLDICLKESTTDSFLAYYYLYAYSGSATLDSTLINPTAPLTVINSVLSNGPYTAVTAAPSDYTYDRIQSEFNVTAPAVSFASSPLILASRLDGDFNFSSYGVKNLNDGVNNNVITPHNVVANIRVEHVNTAPSLSNLQPQSVQQSLTSSGQTVNIPVSADYSDAESNHSNITFELTNDNFATILQTVTMPAVASGTTVSHTFTALGLGDYNWRVSAVETDALGNCAGYANADPAINLSFTSSNQTGGTGSIRVVIGTLASSGENYQLFLAGAVASVVAGISSLYVFSRKKLRLK